MGAIRSAFLCAAAFAPALGGFAQAPTFTPADFAGENRLVGIALDQRDIADGQFQALVRCQGFIKIDGTISEESCMALNSREHRAQLDAVIDAIPNQRFKPATVDGMPVRVLMNFAVLFVCADRACQSVPMRNHGYYFEQHGLAYFDPQPILAGLNWYTSFEDKLEWTRRRMPTVGELMGGGPGRNSSGRRSVTQTDFSAAPVVYNLTADVAVDGTAGNPQVAVLSGGAPDAQTAHDAQALFDAFVGVPFVPGFSGKGEPIAIQYVEPVIDIDVR
jgi:hypothetical protein